MAFVNRMTRLLDTLEHLPRAASARLFSFGFGRLVPFVATAGVRIEEVTEGQVVVSVKNRRSVRNHVGGVHAAAVALLAETASGLLVGRNLPDSSLPLIKSMRLQFVRRNQGSFRAVATLTPAQVDTLRSAPKGELVVPVSLSDERGEDPVTCEMLWAWVPSKR